MNSGTSYTPPPARGWRLRGMRRRWWMFQPLDWLVRWWPVRRPPRGLLVVRMDGIGDMVLFRRALDRYAEVFDVAREDITVLGCRSWGSIANEVFAGYRVRAIDEHAFERKILYRFREALWVRRQGFAIAVCDMYFRKALTADSLVWFANAPRQVVTLPYISDRTRPEFTYYLRQAWRVIDTGDYPTHEIVRHFRFLSVLAERTYPPEIPTISWRDHPPPVAETTSGRPYVVLNFGSNEPGRRWPFAHYLALAERLLDHGLRVAFTGGSGERAFGATLRRELNRPGVINLIGRTSLPELLDLLRHARATVSNDTGPAHVSIALGTPTVVIFGGGHFGSFMPYPPEAAPPHAGFVHHEMPCYHCFWRCDKERDDQSAFPCIEAVTVEAVWTELAPRIGVEKGGETGGGA
ncbi:MAG: glycosyltransferase family 9 protein [Alphaproteobacteria bacterium]